MKVTKDVWLIMDKQHQAVACGVPRDRRMVLLKNLDTGRLLTYGSEGKAKAGFKVSGFYDETWDTPRKSRWTSDENDEKYTYLQKTYGEEQTFTGYDGKQYKRYLFHYEDICEAVKATITLEIE